MIQAETAHVPCCRLAGHGHKAWHLCAVLDGGFEEIEHGRGQVLEAGAYRVSRPNAFHDLNFDAGGAHCVMLEAHGDFWPRVFARQVAQGATHRFARTAPAELRRAADVFGHPSHLRADGLQDACETLFTPRDEHGDRRISAIVEDAWGMIVQSRGALSISAFAARSRTNRGVLARRFRDAHGLTPVEFRKLQRLKYAIGLIVEDATPLATAAGEAGYADQSHMTHDFVSIIGATPAALRRTALAAA